MDTSTPTGLLLKIQHQETAIQKLTLLAERQAAEIANLQAELSVYRNKKNSRNSHVPPSRDDNRPQKNQSLRRKTDKKPGGQHGHEGFTLQCSATPDEVIEHIPRYCNRCGSDLSHLPEERIACRQVIDIAVVQPVCTEHRVYRKTCSCGCCMESDFPSGVSASVQYGAGVQALTGYLHARQYMPYGRMQEFFSDVFHLPLSTGSLHNMLNKIVQKAATVYGQIKERISKAVWAGTDETSMKVNGEKHWFWTWQNDALTFIAHSDNRAFATIEKHFPDGLPHTVLQHDRYAAHFRCDAAGHQICMAHLLRDLQYINELYAGCEWGADMKTLIHQALALKQKLTPADYYKPDTQRTLLQTKLDQLLLQSVSTDFPKTIALQKNLRKHAGAIFTFLYHPKVPADNNGSERAIRNIKVKQKISTQFKSGNGAAAFAVLRSVIDTAIKNDQNALNALVTIANTEAE